MDEVKTNAERLAAIQAAVEEQAVAWIERMQATGAIERRVHDELDKRANAVVVQLLGFDWDSGVRSTWKLDHCNGRAGNSAAGDWLRERAANEIRSWLDAQAGALPPLSEDSKSDLRNEYTRVLKYELSKALRKRAEADAAAMVAGIVASVTGGDV